MSKKKQTKKQEKVESSSYKLNTKAVDRLVNADKKTYSDTKSDPGKQYRSNSFIDNIPSPVKALFIKFWFNAAVCFFIYWGLGMFVPNFWDMMLILGVVLGVANDILTNSVLHFFARTPGSNNKWMMFPKKKFWTFFANILYCTIVLFIVVWIYNIVNIAMNAVMGTDGLIYLGVEPLVFGLLFMGADMLFVSIKNLLIRIVTDAKEKAKVS